MPNAISRALSNALSNYRTHIVRRELKETLVLALPVVGSQLGLMSMGFVDTVMVGRLGPEALAAVALGSTLYFFLAIVCMGVVFAVGPMVSQAFGAQEYDVIGRSVRQGLWVGVALAVPSIILLRNANLVFDLMGHDPATAALATAYIRAIVWGFLPFLWFAALRGFVEGVSRPFPVTVITLVGLGVNILANYVLIYGKFGFPELGAVGAGYASAIVFWFMCAVLAVMASRHSTLKPFAVFSQLRLPDTEYFGKLFRIGWPIGALHGVEAGLFSVTALLIGVIGTTDLAAHQVAIQFAAFTFMVPLGIGIATSVRVGQAVGRGDPVGTRWAGYVGIGLAISFMGCAALLLWATPESVVALYLDVDDPANTEVVAMAVRLLGFAALFQVFDGAQVSAAGALRGLKDTRGPMVIGILSYWGVGLSTGCILGFGFDRGAAGLWTGLVLGLVFASVALIWRFAFASRRASNRMVDEASA